jgi:hypothetical protein
MFGLLFELIYPRPWAFGKFRGCFKRVAFVDRSLFKLAHEAGASKFVFGQNQDPTGRPIQAMDHPQVALELFLEKFLHVGVPQPIGFHHEASPLGYHDDVAV